MEPSQTAVRTSSRRDDFGLSSEVIDVEAPKLSKILSYVIVDVIICIQFTLQKSASSPFRLPNVSPPNVDRRGEDEHEVASTNFFEDSLRGMSTSRGAVGYVDSREKNTWITNNIGMLESFELKEVVRFAQSVEKFHALYPNQTLTWGKVIHSDVLSILVPILERLHREDLVGQQPTRYLANISWQELVRALADRVAPNSVPEMKSALAALVSKFQPCCLSCSHHCLSTQF